MNRRRRKHVMARLRDARKTTVRAAGSSHRHRWLKARHGVQQPPKRIHTPRNGKRLELNFFVFCFFNYLAISARRRAFIYSCRRFQSFLVSHRHRLCEDVARNTVLHVDISAHHSPHGHRFLLTLVGALNFKFLSKPEISSISLSLRSKLVTSKFCCRRFAELDLGITLRPRCVDQRSRTCAGVLPCASEIFLMTGWSNRRGVSAAIFISHSMKLWGPKDEYAVTLMSCCLASSIR